MTPGTYYVYSVEEFKPKVGWKTETRFYYCEKRLSDFDLRTIPGLRKNATFKGKITI